MGCIVSINQSEVGFLERFGEFEEVLPPGCHVMNCCFKKVRGTLSLRTHVITGEISAPTLDQAEVHAQVAIMYRVIPTEAVAAFYKLANPTIQIKNNVDALLRPLIRSKKLDELFEERDAMGLHIKTELRKTMQNMGYDVVDVLVPSLTPIGSVREAMEKQLINRLRRQVSAMEANIVNIRRVTLAEAGVESDRLRGVGTAEARRIISTAFSDASSNGSSDVTTSQLMAMILMMQYFDLIRNLDNDRTIFTPLC